MEGLSVLTAVLRILGIPLLFSFNNTHLYIHTLPRLWIMLPFATSLRHWLALDSGFPMSVWGFINILITMGFVLVWFVAFFFSRRELIYIFIWIMIPWWRSEPRGRQLEETEEKKSTGKAGRQNRSCHTAGWRSDRQGALGTSHFLWIKILPFRNFWMCFRTFGNLTEQWHYQKCHESCTVTSQTTIIVALFGRQMLTDLFCSGSVRKPLYLSCLNYVQYLDPLCSY